ncbi:NAD(P)/FAD-dependent oxidoreductase [Actinophytocola sp.]|uniref:NAD(P)/FAD-dependent oxidoreductase n=1 Tax=Actinophytocola sp. TaxID=1872138 RepID=UPI002D5E57BB|nr:FAD-dependent monooxygenase [Actinophytocola sp.]HYQ63937.1 FAD-dependent monooxygenase [Actinophytocola sp.]
MRSELVVIGAGPAGACAAAVAARAGRDVLLVDRGTRPGTHLPESWHGGCAKLLAAIGVADPFAACRDRTRVRLGDRTGVLLEIELRARRGGTGVRLDRVSFDEMLLANALAQGARHLPGHGVRSVDLAGRPSLVVHGADGEITVTADYLVDAGGKSALVGTAAGLVTESPVALDPRVIVFSHHRPAGADPLTEQGSMTVLRVRGGYLFVIPVAADRVSVGAVVAARRAGGADPAAVLAEAIAEVPEVAALVGAATRLLPPIVGRNHTYRCTRFAGENFAIAGDAAAFADPFFCTGIDFAVRTGIEAGRAAAHTLAGQDPVAVADRYGAAVDAALTDLTAGALPRLTSGASAALLAAVVDPHLPSVLPLAALLTHAGGGAVTEPRAAGLVAAGRSAFADIPA